MSVEREGNEFPVRGEETGGRERRLGSELVGVTGGEHLRGNHVRGGWIEDSKESDPCRADHRAIAVQTRLTRGGGVPGEAVVPGIAEVPEHLEDFDAHGAADIAALAVAVQVFVELDEGGVVFDADASAEGAEGGGEKLGVAFGGEDLEGEFAQLCIIAPEGAEAVQLAADFGGRGDDALHRTTVRVSGAVTEGLRKRAGWGMVRGMENELPDGLRAR